MSTENPTPLRVGATGTLDGKRWRVAGRVVLGVEIDGETYYWNEFNLVDGFGRSATLVFEEGDDGPEWKLFQDYTPLRALTAAEAATKRVGQSVNLDGTPRTITLADESRVYHIDGVGPEGVEVGDVANYFNVDTGERMLVASWTGDEIEFYEGNDVPAAKVAAAFGFPATPPALQEFRASSGGSPSPRWAITFVGFALAAIVLASFFTCSRGRKSSSPRPPPAATRLAPAPKLALGALGTVDQATYTVAGRAMMEIAHISGPFEWEEYSLVSGTGERAFLVRGLTRVTDEWHALMPVTPAGALARLTPHDAAVLRKDAPVAMNDRALRVLYLFRAQPRATEGKDTSATWPAVQYGFFAAAGSDYLIARWTESGIQFFRNTARLKTPEVLAAFGPGPETPR